MTDGSAARRIILTGAAGVGKTSLLEALGPVLGLPVIPELGRKICEERGYKQIGEIPNQEEFKREVLNAQIAEEIRLDKFISDRSVIDCWVLWQRWNMCSAMTYHSEEYYEQARVQSKIYTHIIYVPPMFPPSEDGFRWTDADYQKQIDRLVRLTLYDWDLWDRTYQIKSEEVHSRRKEVQEWLAGSE
jgi:predicted ATPase